MTFLELCKRLRSEAQIAGSGPTTVIGQVGENLSLVSWIQTAWIDIQLMRAEWMWMQREFSFNTTPGKSVYTPEEAGITTRFKNWDITSMQIQRTGSEDGWPLEPISYPAYRTSFTLGPQSPGQPEFVAVDNSLNLRLGCAPNAQGFTVTGLYRTTAQRLDANESVPEMPEDYHMMIVYRALVKYARAEAAGEIYADALNEFKEYKRRLELDQLPGISMSGPLV